MIVQRVELAFKGGGSDKVYRCEIDEVSPGLYTVPFAYGRRGSTLNVGNKFTAPVDFGTAEKKFQSLIAEKVGKGYEPAPGVTTGGAVFVPGRESSVLIPQKDKSGILPQLLNDIDEVDVESLIKDPDWGMQEKKNGERRMVSADGNTGELLFINKKGFIIPETASIAAAVHSLGIQVLLDAEQIADTLYCFGILELKGKDLRTKTYKESFSWLEYTLEGKTGTRLEIVPLASTEEEKRALLKKVRDENGEGVVFKRLDSLFVEGKPATGGDHLKFKFKADGQFLCLGPNEGKRSIRLGVIDQYSAVVEVGNCTIPSNHNIPEEGEIVAVQYLYAYPGGCLYQPVYLGKRTDQDCSDCTIGQLKFYAGNEAQAREIDLATAAA